ncbi:MAG: ABC transporter ATP-binding protein [Opitutales bacterium]
MATPFLRIRRLKKRFGTNKVLDGVDLDVERGKVTTIVGKSGIGKSVLLKCMVGLLKPDSGTIELDGQPLEKNPHKSKANDGVLFSYMFQNNALFDSLTAFENVALPLRERTKLRRSEVRDRVNSVLKKLDLSESADHHPGELSGGMKKRVALARALVTDPEVVLFDEPTTGLDPQRKFHVFKMIADYRERFGFTALLVSHDVPEVFEISDRLAWLDGGRIRFFGKPSELEPGVRRELCGVPEPAASSGKRDPVNNHGNAEEDL